MLDSPPMRESEAALTRRGGLAVLDVAVAGAVAAAIAFWNASFHVVPTATGTWSGMSDAPSAARVALSVALGALVAWGLARFPPAVRRPFVAFATAALPLAPVLTGRLLILLVFQGGVLRLLAGAIVAVAIIRLAAVRGARMGRVPAGVLFAAAFVFYCAWGQRVPGAAGPQGDEPHYLVMAQSLLSDGDLDLTDEFASREYAPFYGGDLAPHASPNTRPGRVYSMHSPGLPALLLPAYAAGGYAGARLMQSALAALAGVLLYRLVRDVTKDDGVSAGAWALATFTPPLAFYAVTLYPETLAALAVVAFLLTARAAPAGISLAAATTLAVLLPWVHTKFIPLAAAGVAFTLIRPCRWPARATVTAAFVASLGLLALYFQSLYGSPSFSAALGPADVSPRRIPWGVAGAFFDRQYGLLVVAPALALAVPGAIALWRRRTGDAFRAAILVVLVVLPAAAYVGWWGGAAPPARYVLPVIGPLVLAAAVAAPRVRDVLAALGGMGVAVLGLAADAPRMLRNRPDGESLLLRSLSPDLDINAWLPSFIEGGWRAPVLAASLVAAAAIAWHWRRRGIIVGLLGYALVANGVRDRPMIDQGQATQRLLSVWDGGDPRGLAIPFELPRGPWTLDPGEGRNTRRLLLPPGAYQVRVRAHPLEMPALVRVEVHAGDLVLGRMELAGGDALLPLLLPAGGRGLGASAYGVAGRAEIDEMTVLPQAVVARGRREGFDWPELADTAHYRVEWSGVRVTVLDRSAPEGGGFRVRGTGAFLLEAPVGASVRMTVRRTGSDEADVVDVDTARAVALGGTAVIPVRVPADDALVTFAVTGR